MESSQDQHHKVHEVVVLGSASADFFFKVDKVPHIGETIHCHHYEKSFGGKGAN
jgi:sugar/nucleoside kinase (ribokinase family)